MSILELLDILEDELENSPNIPLSTKKKVDIEKIYQILDEIRDEFPEAIQKAEKLLREKQFILDDAKTQADTVIREAERRASQIVEDAERRAKKLVEDDELSIAAKRNADEIMETAQRNSKEMRNSARIYADDVLGDIEGYLGEYIELVRRNRTALDVKSKDSVQRENRSEPRRESIKEQRAEEDRPVRDEEPPREEKKGFRPFRKN